MTKRRTHKWHETSGPEVAALAEGMAWLGADACAEIVRQIKQDDPEREGCTLSLQPHG